MSDFPHKLNEWVEEEKEIPTFDPIVDKKGNITGVKEGIRKVSEKVMYTQLSTPQILSCNELQHYWFIKDRHSHIAHCKKCKKRQFIRAVYEQVRDGKILNRDTQEQIG